MMRLFPRTPKAPTRAQRAFSFVKVLAAAQGRHEGEVARVLDTCLTLWDDLYRVGDRAWYEAVAGNQARAPYGSDAAFGYSLALDLYRQWRWPERAGVETLLG